MTAMSGQDCASALGVSGWIGPWLIACWTLWQCHAAVGSEVTSNLKRP
jgi:hypothetical protein